MTFAEKYFLLTVLHPICDGVDWDSEDVEKELESIDFFTFNWKAVPKPILIEIFNRFSDEMLIVICAHFQVNNCKHLTNTLDMINEFAGNIRNNGEKPSSLLFKENAFGIARITKAEKYLLVEILCPTLIVSKLSITEVDEQLKSMDFLHFPWKKLPKCIFIDIFSCFTFKRLLHFCGHYQVHVDTLKYRNIDMRKMVSDLWDTVSSK